MKQSPPRSKSRSSPHCRVLLTGFEPFGTHRLNPSELLVRELQSTDDVARVELHGAVLPTSYAAAGGTVVELLERLRPDFALHLGLAANRSELSLERVAKNLDDSASQDNSGEVRQRCVIVPGAAAKYETTLPLQSLVQTAALLGENVRHSSDAGSFVCNHVLFNSLHWAHTSQVNTRIGFVHLPYAEPGEPRFERFASVLRAWLTSFGMD